MKVTIDDVARRAGVSKTTVSRILNGNYGQTTEETRNRILDVIKEMDYRPNIVAKSLKSMRTNVIGIVLSNLKNPYWMTVLEGVEDTCRDLGYNLMICNSDEQPEMEMQYIKEFQMRQVDGIVINPTVRNMELYAKLASDNYPFVVINRKVPGLSAHHVVVDNVKGAELAVNHLVRAGRKKVAVFVYRNPHVSTWAERVEGYRSAMLENGFAPGDLLICEVEQGAGATTEAVIRFLRERPDVEAIFSTNNMMTLDIIKGIKELRLRIPDDIAIIGYDETVWAQHLDPPLTTVMQPAYEMGRISAKMLIKRINAKRQQKPETVVLEPQLIVRASCGAAGRV